MSDIALFVLRVLVGTIFILHGLPKLKNPAWSANVGVPKQIGLLVGVGEVFGGTGLILGLFTRVAALGPLLVMAGALYFHIFKWKDPFVSTKGGYEYPLLLFAISLFFLLTGAGAWSVDAFLF